MQDNVTQEREVGRNYLIRKGGYWYRPDCAGYTGSALEAGRYTLDEAMRLTHPNGPDGPRDGLQFFHINAIEWPRLASTTAQTEAVQTLVDALEKAVAFYDNLSRPHDEGEAKLLDEMAAALAAHRESQP